MKRTFGVILAALVGAVAAFLLVRATGFGSPGAAGVTSGDQEAARAALDGPLAPYRGQVVLVDFWATWCAPCRKAMPGMQRLHERYADDPVSVIGANVFESGDPVAFMEQNGYTYDLITGADAMAEAFEVQAIPAFVLIGPEGDVLYKAVGYDPAHEKEIAGRIDEALGAM